MGPILSLPYYFEEKEKIIMFICFMVWIIFGVIGSILAVNFDGRNYKPLRSKDKIILTALTLGGFIWFLYVGIPSLFIWLED